MENLKPGMPTIEELQGIYCIMSCGGRKATGWGTKGNKCSDRSTHQSTNRTWQFPCSWSSDFNFKHFSTNACPAASSTQVRPLRSQGHKRIYGNIRFSSTLMHWRMANKTRGNCYAKNISIHDRIHQYPGEQPSIIIIIIIIYIALFR